MTWLYKDPYPKLIQDTHLWVKLFRSTAYIEDRKLAIELLIRLNDMRAAGTLLKPSVNGLRFVPLIYPDGWYDSVEFFEEIKIKYLKPYATEIRRLLDRVEGR
jgi:hypothetical protein